MIDVNYLENYATINNPESAEAFEAVSRDYIWFLERILIELIESICRQDSELLIAFKCSTVEFHYTGFSQKLRTFSEKIWQKFVFFTDFYLGKFQLCSILSYEDG